jgi:hypothetical protein
MSFSIVGLLVAGLLWIVDHRLKGYQIVALLSSLAFGATSFATLSGLGGSSPLIYTLFCLTLFAATLLKSDFAGAMHAVFKRFPIAWVLLLLMLCVAVGSYVSPRLFRNETLVFVTMRTVDGNSVIRAFPLGPSTGNLTQGAYFVLGALTFFGVSMTLLDRDRLECVRLGMFSLCALILLTGMADLAGKLIGAGDVLSLVRTASYSMMTGDEHAVAGFARINGAFSEASSFAGLLLPCLTFTFSYWRLQRDRLSFVMSAVFCVLLLLSTSTTAYATIGVIGLWHCSAVLLTALWRGRIRVADLIFLVVPLVVISLAIAIFLVYPKPFMPLFRLLEIMVLEKTSSDSAIERGSWNTQAMQNLIDTHFLGVGIGSARTSSWLIAVLSQFGLLGAILMLTLVIALMTSRAPTNVSARDCKIVALMAGSRAAALTSLLAATLASASPDPGVLFFVLLATVLACRYHLQNGVEKWLHDQVLSRALKRKQAQTQAFSVVRWPTRG